MNERLEYLLTELGKHFGKNTRWKLLCLEQDAATEETRSASRSKSWRRIPRGPSRNGIATDSAPRR